MVTDKCPSKAVSWGADGTHLFLSSANNECFFCNANEKDVKKYLDELVNTQLCADCDATATVTLEPYGEGTMAVYSCPNCGESYDTNTEE